LEQKRDIYGTELALQYPLSKTLTASADISLVHSGDDQDEYRVLAYSIVPPGGDPIDVYENWSQPYDQGPEWMVHFSLDWSISSDSNLLLTASTGGETVSSYAKGTIKEHYDTPFLVSLAYNLPGFLRDRDRFSLRVTNLLDVDYKQPDVYGPVDGKPLTLTLVWKFIF